MPSLFTQPNLTKDNNPPYVANVETTGSGYISNNQTGVSISSGYTWLHFNEFVKRGQGNISLREAKLTGNLTYSANATTIDTTSYGSGIVALSTPALINGQKYFIVIDQGVVKDRADNNVYASSTFNFTTTYDDVPPYILYGDTSNATSFVGAGGNRSLLLTMNEAVQDGAGEWYLTRSYLDTSVSPKILKSHNVASFTTTSTLYTIASDLVTIRPIVYRYGHYTLKWTQGAVMDLATRARAPAYNNIAVSDATTEITFDSPFPDLNVHVICVGGGGGGASGGGGGGQVANAYYTFTQYDYHYVEVGDGGLPGVMESVPGGVTGTIYGCSSGSNGGDTTFDYSMTAVGGGGGGGKAANVSWFSSGDYYPAGSGGSGGGGGTPSHELTTGTDRPGAVAVTAVSPQRQGYKGGDAVVGGAKNPYSGGGGGGAGGLSGSNIVATRYGYGGVYFTIGGTNVSRGGTGYDSTALSAASSYGGGGDGKVGRYTGASVVGTAGQPGVVILQHYNAPYLSPYGAVLQFDGNWAVTYSGGVSNAFVSYYLTSNGYISWL
ncbi:hypothetical protein UFOVP245_108 [uncultured Caudovirales phage]|uniref:Glycine-rich domain-containing protein n=1 Tax=uncultured Caudovirales phage TaxID=2100421 RepID=A0A6J7WTE0_9CAUD|nr:hypothetical protein UFOVP245_108 [uncultured Caudovirales phage]